MNNPYKRTDVFVCNYESHARFKNRVSVYHVLKEKKCYPQGCIFFKWSCELRNKGKKCIRNFKYMGRLCEGCTYYLDEKINYQPRLKLSKLEYERFTEELESFDDWIEEIKDHKISFWCRIGSLKPRFKRMIDGSHGHFRLDGYVAVCCDGFIGTTAFDGYFYVYISPRLQDRLRPATGDAFEAKGYVTLDRGRLLIHRVHHIEFEMRSGEKGWSNSEALVCREIASRFSHQPESCLHCPHGALVDTQERKQGKVISRRELYCLEGIADPETCYIAPLEKIDMCKINQNKANYSL
ncbi:hypothetical protein GF407_08430 [candidate division KSB1 bacterium]|nr:hypothetical protein [candidate division KSB1 bacterium]